MAFNGEILEIFSWLPAKAIYKFSSVCKSCNGFAIEHFFTKRQYQNMQVKDDSSFLVQPNSCQSYKAKVELHSFDSTSGVPSSSLDFIINTGRVLASSNGLICCRNTNKLPTELFICNPATRSWLSIPLSNSLRDTNMDLKIVFECSRDQYVLLAMEPPKDWSSNLNCKIYSPEERTWKERGSIIIGERNIQFEAPVYYNGVVHFISDSGPYLTKGSSFYWPYIVAYDIQNGSSRFLKIPKSARKGLNDQSCKLGIFKWGNATNSFKSICLIKLRKNVFSAWVLIDHNSSLWTRIMKMRVRAMGLMESNPTVAGFTVLNGNSLLIATEEKIYRYSLSGERHERVEEICGHQCGRSVFFHPYSNTLRPCGDGATSLPT